MDWRGGEYSPAPVVSAVTVHKTFGPTDLMSMGSEGIRGHQTWALQSGVRCSNSEVPKLFGLIDPLPCFSVWGRLLLT
ncbi:hypothetical protein TNCV_3218731 [Trichonephila clavipes]|nr:hypothetical protein TNCV_3218731 [Trichonephila clavipes]